MIKILQVVSSLKKNGTETFIMNAWHALDKKEITFDFLIFDNSKDGYYEEIVETESKVFILPSRKDGFFKYLSNLDNFFRTVSIEYEAIHFHCTSFTTIAPLYFAKKYGIKKRIAHIHGSNCRGFHNKVLHSINKQFIPFLSNIYLSCSSKASKWGYKTTRIFSKSEIIPNGINVEKFKFDYSKREKIREKLNLKSNAILLIHVGMLNPIKNHKFLIDIIKELKDQEINYKLICIGEGNQREYLENYAVSQRVSSLVSFLGHKNNIADFLSAADIFVFPSLHEGFGISLLEAQANGLPVLCSSGIPQEVNLSSNFNILDLKEGAKVWAKKISEIALQKNIREESPSIQDHSIATTINALRRIYM